MYHVKLPGNDLSKGAKFHEKSVTFKEIAKLLKNN